jgi:hypothetical protein
LGQSLTSISTESEWRRWRRIGWGRWRCLRPRPQGSDGGVGGALALDRRVRMVAPPSLGLRCCPYHGLTNQSLQRRPSCRCRCARRPSIPTGRWRSLRRDQRRVDEGSLHESVYSRASSLHGVTDSNLSRHERGSQFDTFVGVQRRLSASTFIEHSKKSDLAAPTVDGVSRCHSR